MNPIALALILTGTYLFLRGISLFRKGKTKTGTFFSIMGLVAIAIPFVVTYFLTR